MCADLSAFLSNCICTLTNYVRGRVTTWQDCRFVTLRGESLCLQLLLFRYVTDCWIDPVRVVRIFTCRSLAAYFHHNILRFMTCFHTGIHDRGAVQFCTVVNFIRMFNPYTDPRLGTVEFHKMNHDDDQALYI